MDWKDPEQVKKYYQDYYRANEDKWKSEEALEKKRKYRSEHSEQRRQQWRDYYHRHKEEIAEKQKQYRPADNAAQKAKRQGPRGDEVRAYHKWWLREHGTRTHIVTALGGKCVRCGFDDIRALQVDHVNGGGRQEEKQFKNTYQRDKYILEHVDSGNYQVLCANCNWIKRDEENEHRWNKRE